LADPGLGGEVLQMTRKQTAFGLLMSWVFLPLAIGWGLNRTVVEPARPTDIFRRWSRLFQVTCFIVAVTCWCLCCIYHDIHI
jgi:hypothetical protein